MKLNKTEGALECLEAGVCPILDETIEKTRSHYYGLIYYEIAETMLMFKTSSRDIDSYMEKYEKFVKRSVTLATLGELLETFKKNLTLFESSKSLFKLLEPVTFENIRSHCSLVKVKLQSIKKLQKPIW